MAGNPSLTGNGQKFAKLVEATGWKQKQVADKLRVTPPSVSQMLSGERDVTNGTLDHFTLIVAREMPHLFRESARKTADDPEQTISEHSPRSGVPSPRTTKPKNWGAVICSISEGENSAPMTDEDDVTVRAVRLMKEIKDAAPERLPAIMQVLEDTSEAARRKKK